MASIAKRRWPGDGAGFTRRDRRPCDYAVYMPDAVADRTFVLDGDVAADIADAEAAIIRLDASASTLADTEALARLLLRAECVASSRIEGLVVGARRLLRADAARQLGEPLGDVTAAEVLGNIDAMGWGVSAVDPGSPLELGMILGMHRRLVAGTRLEKHGGSVRNVQNWVGGSDFNPCSATFVPPPPEVVLPLLDDLFAFCNEDGLPALAQAALAHSQFETIHPFVDGNGRTGRALIHLILRRRGLAKRVYPPVSLVLATLSRDYIGGLTATRYVGANDSADAHAGINRWVAFFASACRRAAADAVDFEAQVRQLRDSWHGRVGSTRRDSAARLLIDALPMAPIVTVATAANLIERSFQATNQAIRRLVDAGILAQITVGRRNRAFEAPELVEEFAAFERQLASPEGDSRIAPPARPVPRRLA